MLLDSYAELRLLRMTFMEQSPPHFVQSNNISVILSAVLLLNMVEIVVYPVGDRAIQARHLQQFLPGSSFDAGY